MSDERTQEISVAPQQNNGRTLSVFSTEQGFDTALKMAMKLSESSMIPETYRSNIFKNGKWEQNPDGPGNCLIALEMSNRLGISPLMIMQNVDVIYGRPSMRGTLIAALVNADPRFSRLKYETRGEEGTKERAYRAYATEVATGDVLYGVWIDWKMVQAEGWDKKTGSKWMTMPEQMFVYRSSSFWEKQHAPDIMLGLQETTELEDAGFIEGSYENVGSGRKSLSSLNERLDAVPDKATESPTPEKSKQARTRKPSQAMNAEAKPENNDAVSGEPGSAEQSPVDSDDALPEPQKSDDSDPPFSME